MKKKKVGKKNPVLCKRKYFNIIENNLSKLYEKQLK
jgi:hypothetical protein